MHLSGWVRDERGGIAIMAAVFGTIMCSVAALAVDLASISLQSRQIQGVADLSAMAAARDLTRADAAANATARANLSELETVVVRKGSYVADSKLKPSERFSMGNADPNAAQVEITAPADLFFGRWILQRESIMVRKRATAALPGGQPQAMFSIGSRLASVDGGLANKLLGGLLGTNVSLSVADYRSLADLNINLLQFSDALATEIGVTAGDYDALLKHDVEAGQVLKVMELVGGGKNSALKTLTSVPLKTKLKLKDLIGVEAGAEQGLRDSLNANVSALSMIMASLEAANGSRQVALNRRAGRIGQGCCDGWGGRAPQQIALVDCDQQGRADHPNIPGAYLFEG